MSQLHKAFDAAKFREDGHNLIDQLADYFEHIFSADNTPVLPWQPPQEAYLDWKNYLSESSPASDFFQKIIQKSIHLHHPKYMGHQVAPPLPESILNGILIHAMKNGSGIYEMSPLAAPMEKIVIAFFSKYIGFDEDASGFLTSGGTLANLTALLTARQIKSENDVWKTGNSAQQQLAVMVSEESHYSVERAIKIMGLGEEGLIKIPTNKSFQVDINQLETTYQNAIAQGKTVFAIIGNACSTSVGAFDDLSTLGVFAKKHNLWFHVDGAHGGVAIFSKKYREKVNGIELADSVIIDGHKMMLTAGLTTAVIYREAKNSYLTFRQKAHYLWENNQEEWFNITKRTFECTKFTGVIELYSMIKNYREKIFEEYVNITFDLVKTFALELDRHEKFEIAHLPEANILCFRIFDDQKNKTALNDLNNKVRKKLTHQGEFYLVQTQINGNVYFRISLMNPFTTIEILRELIDEILLLVEEIGS